MNSRTAITHYTATCAAGTGLDALRRSLRERRTGLRRNDFPDCDLETWIGRVEGLEGLALPDHLGHFESRNNRLAWLGLQQDEFSGAVENAVDRFGATRVGMAMGTSTSSIGETENAYRAMLDDANEVGNLPLRYREPRVHNPHSPGDFVAEAFGIEGPAMTISTACSSSAKVFAAARRWLQAGLVDAVLVGGVDSLCLSVLYGFNSLGLVSGQRCRPFGAERNGINLGEAAAYALLMRAEDAPEARVSLAGYGESTDAYHMSHPHPEGLGAAMAMEQALGMSGLESEDIAYLNLHGTATPANDTIETRAVAARFPDSAVAASTKGYTGHALGAAGALEAIIALDAVVTGLLPGNLSEGEPDPELAFPIEFENVEKPIRASLTNSFGFGGNNCSLVFAA